MSEKTQIDTRMEVIALAASAGISVTALIYAVGLAIEESIRQENTPSRPIG